MPTARPVGFPDAAVRSGHGRSHLRCGIPAMVLLVAAGAGCGARGPAAGPIAGVHAQPDAGRVHAEPSPAERRQARALLDDAWVAWQQGDVRDAVDAIVADLAGRPKAVRSAILRAVAADDDAGDDAATGEVRSWPPAVADPAVGLDLMGVPGWAVARLTGQDSADPRDDRSLAAVLAAAAAPGAPTVGRVRPRVDPDAAAAARERFRRAADALAEGRTLQAVVELREAGRLDPTQPSIQRSLARVAEQLGNASLARQAWQDLLAIDRADPEAVLALAADTLRSGRPLAGLALLSRLEPAMAGGPPPLRGAADSGDAIDAIDAWCRDALLMDACERLGADAAVEQVAERMLASAVDVAAARRVAIERSLPEAAAGRIEIARRLGDARWRGDRPAEAEVAYAMASTIAADLPLTSAADRRERAGVLVRRVALATEDARPREAARRVQEAAATAPDDAAALVLAMHLVEPSRAGVRELALVAGRISPAAAARATAVEFAWPASAGAAFGDPGEPIASGFIRRAERLHPDGPPWPHPLPELADAAARRLHRADRPLSADRLGEASRLLEAAVLEACGWLGRAWTAVDGWLADVAAGSESATPATIAAAHVMRIRLAGLLQEPQLLSRVIAEARAAAAASATTAEGDGWAVRREIAAATALARVGRLEEAVRTAGDLPAAVHASDADAAGEEGSLVAAARLTMAAALVERAIGGRRGPGAAADARTAVELASGRLTSRPTDAVAWMLIESVLAPTGPVPDPAAAARQRRRWADAADAVPAAARDADRLERARLMAAGRFEAVDDAARLRLLMDPLDETAIEDLLAARTRAGRAVDATEWLRQRERRHPADPAAAAAGLRLDAEAGRAEEAWSRLERRLAADSGDLVALRLAEAAAGFAGDRMMQLVMAETRLMERPPGPHRGLLLAGAAFAAGQARECLRAVPAFIAGAAEAGERDLAAAASLLGRIRGGGDPGPAADAADLEVALAEAVLPRLANADAADAAATADAAAATLERLVVRGVASAAVAEGSSPRVLAWVDRLAGHATGARVSDIDPWRSLAAELLQRERGSEAATLIIRRLLRGPERGAAASRLLLLAVATDAAAGPDPAAPGTAGTRTRSMLERLAADGRLPASGRAEDDPLAIALGEAAFVHREIGDEDGAERLLDAALQRRPADPSLLNDLGYARLDAAIRAGRVVAADPAIAGLIERAHALDPANPAILDSLGWLRYRQGRITGGPDDAVDLLERAAATAGSPSPEGLLHLGDARWRAGRREAAIDAWRAASELLVAPGFREGLEQGLGGLQREAWGVLVRDPAAMYHARFGRLAEDLRIRLEAGPRGDDPMPVTATDAEASSAGRGP